MSIEAYLTKLIAYFKDKTHFNQINDSDDLKGIEEVELLIWAELFLHSLTKKP